MKTLQNITTTLALAAFILASAVAFDTPAHAWTRKTTRSNAAGMSMTTTNTTTPTANGYQHNTTATTGSGATANRSATGYYDPVTKTWNKTVTNTGPAGNSATHTKTTKITP
ncbi:hypothetical protein [Desulfovibrio inopinatus]|uniref:hypothetical protein n=1 Tax=Desulfovibrio inopinatus TaxID=102109 RepID=UPI0003F68A31|nr:hypothetical protein [Desulfovibrio inopinatus]